MSQVSCGFCTVIAKNYLALARVLCQSLKKQHPEIPCFVLIVDSIDNKFDPSQEEFTVVELSLLKIPHYQAFTFKYNATELSTSVKPFLFEYLFKEYQLEKIFFLDPDIYVYQPLDHIFNILETESIVLTPHIMKDFPDKDLLVDITVILLSGVYNLGFLGIAHNLNTLSLLRWWQEKLYDECIIDHSNARFVDQRWMDLAPAMFDKVYILREPGYNVAYWNLHERKLEQIEGTWYSNGKLLYFFHFSGINVNHIEAISKYQNRYNLLIRPEIRPLFEDYRQLLIENQHREICKWPYTYNYFSNGQLILDADRKSYHRLGSNRHEQFPNPFDVSGDTSFRTQLRNPPGTKAWKRKIKSLIPQPVFYRIRQALQSRQRIPYPNYSDKHKRRFVQGEEGINVWGYIKTESGVGEGVRRIINAIEYGELPTALRNIIPPTLSSNDPTYQNFSDSCPYRVNLFHINADQTAYTFQDKNVREASHQRYNIGYWAWELENFPEIWHDAYNYYDEIWTYSTFCANAIAASAPIPVTVIPPPIRSYPNFHKYVRADFDIDLEDFTFLFAFDFQSFFERKNPLAVIEAFKRAFPDKDKSIKLIIKCCNSQTDTRNFIYLQDSCLGWPIKIIDGYLTREQMDSLMQLSNCYISLHRSEGFGFGIADAMTLGKPVIATYYSSNTDFMNPSNSLPVKYALVPITTAYGPYWPGNIWANPSVNHAAELMRYVFENPKEAEEIGQNAKAYMEKFFSSSVVSDRIKKRFKVINSKILT
jgi:glycosyltransferase involved in cell wall biosynthesis